MFKNKKSKLWAHVSHILRNPDMQCAGSEDAASRKWKLKSRQRQLGNSSAPGSGQNFSLPLVMFNFFSSVSYNKCKTFAESLLAAGTTACLKEISIWASLVSGAAKLLIVPVTTLALAICIYRNSFLFSLEINWFLPHRWDLWVSLYCKYTLCSAGSSLKILFLTITCSY